MKPGSDSVYMKILKQQSSYAELSIYRGGLAGNVAGVFCVNLECPV